MQIEVKGRVYIRDWHGRFAHVPGSAHALSTVASGEPIAPLVAAKGWSRVDPRLVEKTVAGDLASEIGPDKAAQVAQRLALADRLPRVYTDGSVTLRIHPDSPPERDQKILLDTAFMQHVSPVKDVDVRLDDDFTTNGSGADLDYDRTGVMGWTATTSGAGNTTIAIRPKAWDPWKDQKRQAGLLMGQADINRGRYLLAHEWGHAALQPSQMSAIDGRRLIDLYQRYNMRLSMYASSSPHEFYAEGFAEWHVSGGTTHNRVVQQMAKEFGWFMADKLPTDAGLPDEDVLRSEMERLAEKDKRLGRTA